MAQEYTQFEKQPDPEPAKEQVSKIQDHRHSIEQVFTQYCTSLENGLEDATVAARLASDGANTFTPPKEKSWIWLLIKELTGGFALLLWFSGIASLISFTIDKNIEDVYIGAVLIFTVLLTGCFSYYQQANSSKVFKSFKNLTPQSCYVLRNSKRQQIPVEDLVVGDIVFCQAGDRIPADIRVVQSNSMKVDNSSITGESEPLTRTVESCTLEDALEASNLAFFSTNCIDGSGIGVVIATGDRTVMGDIASIVTAIGNKQTPIGKEIAFFVMIITILSVVSGAIFFGIAFWFGSTFFGAFLFMIGITVGNVPEGLLPALTVALTLTAKRMASKMCLVKHLEAVETLGSTSTICTDKTGTLTQNRMTVEHLWFGEETFIYREHNIRHDHLEPEQIRDNHDWLALKRCSMLCSRAEFIDSDENKSLEIEQMVCSGDASETAIMRFMQRVEGGVAGYRSLHPKVCEKPFSSSLKYQFSIHRNPHPQGDSNYILVMKGAPEIIIKRCVDRLDSQGNSIPVDERFLQSFEEVYRDFGSNGERVLAFCDLELPGDRFPVDFVFDDLDKQIELVNLRFVGLISMIDPPRPNVYEAVKMCRQAGIRVVMVTGDHPITAQAIAKMVGIISSSHRSTSILSLVSSVSDEPELSQRSIVIPGDELSLMSSEILKEKLLLYREIVFARTSPKQKLEIVEAFQEIGEVVAVTGDGVNDSPALKKADIGVAMGITGSEVSKQAADMILLDDNFSTIVVGVEEGRRIFDNMKKTIAYILSGNVTTIYPFVIFATLGYPLGISVTTALLIALGTDMVPAISLCYEKSEGDIMHIKPRDAKKDRLVDRPLLLKAYLLVGVIATAAGYFSYFVTMHKYGFSAARLFNSRTLWDSTTSSFPRVIGYVGPEHSPVYADTTHHERVRILMEAQSAFFIGVVMVQWIDVIVCKTRRVSVFEHGLRNMILNGSIVFETVLAVLFVYTPHLNTVLQTSPVGWYSWVWTLPFLGFLLLAEEIRKAYIRSHPRSFFARELLS